MIINLRSTQGQICLLRLPDDATIGVLREKLAQKLGVRPKSITFAKIEGDFNDSTLIKKYIPDSSVHILFSTKEIENKHPNHLPEIHSSSSDDESDDDRPMRPLARRIPRPSSFEEEDIDLSEIEEKDPFTLSKSDSDDIILPEQVHDEDEDKILMLADMGYDIEACRTALVACDGDLVKAGELLSSGYQYQVDDPRPIGYGSKQAEYDALTKEQKAEVDFMRELSASPEDVVDAYIQNGKNKDATYNFLLQKMGV